MKLREIEQMHQQYARPAITIDIPAEDSKGLWPVAGPARLSDREGIQKSKLEQYIRVAALLAVGAGIALFGGRLVAMATKSAAAPVTTVAPTPSPDETKAVAPAATPSTSEQWPTATAEPAAIQPPAQPVGTARDTESKSAASEVGIVGKPAAVTPTKSTSSVPSSPARPSSRPEKVGPPPAEIKLF
ncbi:hypothetical protein [Cupriavidus sp. WS]|uniref:hypothetical protein n=1 Tax=Cupriavidus sp. WS TaxID=1312922 RepID=UPI0012DFB164|nr:hypothetical protein [Cupriavidus sp. WS]